MSWESGLGEGFGVKVFFRPPAVGTQRNPEELRAERKEKADFIIGLLSWIRDHSDVIGSVSVQMHMGGAASSQGELSKIIVQVQSSSKEGVVE